ncbi:hypothetical protein GCM10009530_44690 [Microbispora corallina]|uniref:Uncharacterized protein n=1 Tax=Microbispora corallina TaxID=83302 RepID=A0ABQ4FWW3_9ACTN|nr:hypothetical protein Mco01_22720 [Microbispora corallina]
MEAVLARGELDRDAFGEHQFTQDGARQPDAREPGMQPRLTRSVVVHDEVQIVGQRRARKITFSHERR